MSINTSFDSSATFIKVLCERYACSLVETHISWVLLTGQFAYKIKKPVNFGFLDFSTVEKRRHCCLEELRLNKRFAPDLYLEVVPITGTVKHPQFYGDGLAIDYAVKMLQFPASQLLTEYVNRGQLDIGHIGQMADSVANFHGTIAHAAIDSPYGDNADINHWFVENFDQIRPLLVDIAQKQQLQRLQEWDTTESHKLAGVMEQRKQQGYIRECHGDLHLGNMTLLNDKVVLFDCIEFNPLLRWIDVISEVAFLFVDLLHFGYSRYAYRFLNLYLQHTGDYKGLALLPYYLVYRALVRAKVALLRKTQQAGDIAAAKQSSDDYLIYANLAEQFIKPRQTALIITHGYSGSGKSTMASQLAEVIGAFQIRSDIERKRLFGYLPAEQSNSRIDNDLYAPNSSLQTYQYLKELAQATLEAGFPVIIDATFLKHAQRELFRRLATDCCVPFHIISFQASDQELARRIAQRQNDASEATIAVLNHQQKTAQPLSEQELANVVLINTENDNALKLLLNNFDRYLQCH